MYYENSLKNQLFILKGERVKIKKKKLRKTMKAGVETVLWIHDVYPGSEFFHPRSRIQGKKDSGSRIRIRIKEFKYF
jgi:hypothetical protein